MKKIMTIIGCIATMGVSAQNIALTENTSTQIIFPAEIEHYRGGFAPQDFRDPHKYKNILHIQPLGKFTTTNLSVVTVDGYHYAIKLSYDPIQYLDYYVVKSSEAIFSRGARSNEPQRATSVLNDPKIESANDPVITQILQGAGYLAVRNSVKDNSMILAITGVYSCVDKIYLRLEISNASHIPYAIDHIGFSITPNVSGKITSSAELILEPSAIWVEQEQIPAKKSIEVVYGFDKFTVGNENTLYVDLIEHGGARNLILTLTDDIILKAKQI